MDNWTLTRRTSKASHQPVVDAVGVVGVHAGQVADPVADDELDHADHAPVKEITVVITHLSKK